MAGLWDNIKKNVSEFATKAAEKAGEITREAADKAEELTKLGKVKLDIFQIKRDIEKKFTELGGTVYDLVNGTEETDIANHSKVQAIVKDVQNLEVQLKEKEALYEKIRATSKEGAKPETPPPAETDK